MANTPPSVEESLAEPHRPSSASRIAKNLHIIIPGAFVALLTVVMMTQALKEDEKRGPQSLAAQASAEINTSSSVSDLNALTGIEKEMNAQRNAPLPPIPPVSSLPGVPNSLSTAPGGNLPGVPQGRVTSDQDAALAAAAAKREEDIRSSALIALSGGSGTLEAAMSGKTASEKPAIAQQAEAVRDAAAAQRESANKMRETLLKSVSVPGTNRGAMMAGGGAGERNSAWMSSLGAGSTREVIGLEAPGPTPIIHQGVSIPAVLITEINSDIPGQITAMVSMDVYDSIRGDRMLIPKGSKLVGQTNSDLTAGQERLVAGFTRLIRPDGSSVDLKAMQGADAIGQNGLADRVDNHFFKMFSTSFFVAGLAYLFESNNSDTVVVAGSSNTASGLGSEAGQILTDVSRTVLDRYKVIPPTITIRKGHKFNVMVNRDIAITPYN